MTSYFWIAGSGNWKTATDWNPNSPDGGPTSVDSATIDATGSSYAVTIDSAATANSLLINSAAATVNVNAGGTLTIGTTLDIAAGKLNLNSGGTIRGATLHAASDTSIGWLGGTLDGTTYEGTLALTAANSSVHIKNGLTALNAAGNGSGMINVTGSFAKLYFDDTQTFDNATINLGSSSGSSISASDTTGSGSTLTFGANLTINQTSAAQISGTRAGVAIVNQGTINAAGAGASLSISASSFTNQGTINATGSFANLYVIGTSFTNVGTVNVSNGDSFRIGTTNFTNAASGTIVASGANSAIYISPSFVSPSGSWSNAGLISIASGAGLHLGGSFSLGSLGTVTNSGGTVYIEGTFDNTGHALDGSDFFAQAVLNGGTIQGGTVTPAGLAVSSAGGTLDGVTYEGTLALTAANTFVHIKNGLSGSNPGTITVTGSGASLFFDDAQIFDNATINIGTSSGTPSSISALDTTGSGGKTLTFGANLTINQIGSAAISSSGYSGDLILNQGTINATGSGGTLSLSGNGFANTGTINVSNGDTLRIQTTNFTNAASGTIAASGANSAIYITPGGAWTNAGLISIAGGAGLHLGGSFSLASLGTVTNSGGTVYIDGTFDNTGHTLDGSGVFAGAVLNGGTIHGGTVTPAGLAFSSASGTFDGVTYKGTLALANSFVQIRNGLTVLDTAGNSPGTINVSGGGGGLIFDDTQTMDNATINIGDTVDGSSSYITASDTTFGPTALTFGSNLTINLTGNVQISSSGSGASIVNQGTINASSARYFSISASSFINQGTINANTVGNYLSISSSSFTNEGTINASAAGSSSLFYISSSSFTNQGTIKATGSGANFNLTGTSFTNTGTVDVSNGDNFRIQGTTFTNAASGTLAASGVNSEIYITPSGSWSNAGLISITGGAGLHLGGSFTRDNLGTITNSGGTVFIDGTLDNTGHTLDGSGALAGAVLDGGTIHGGIVVPAGLAFSRNGGTLDGVTYEGTLSVTGSNTYVRIENGLTALNAAGTGPGTIDVTRDGNNPTWLFFDGTQTFDNATINLDGSIVITDPTGHGSTLTFGSNVTVDQTGTGSDGIGGSAVAFVNQGTINAGEAGASFYIDPDLFTNRGAINVSNGDSLTIGSINFTNAASGTIAASGANSAIYITPRGSWTNSGLISIANGANLYLGGSYSWDSFGNITNSGGTVFLEGMFDNTGHTLDGSGFLGQAVLYGGTIHGGTVTSAGLSISNFSGTLDGVTYEGTLSLTGTNSQVQIKNGLTALNAAGTGPGTINVTGANATLYIANTLTLDNATINLGNVSGSSIYAPYTGSSDNTLTFGSNLTINQTGTAAIQSLNYGSVINKGTINAIGSNHALLTLNGTSFTNEGTIHVANGDTVNMREVTFTNLVGTTLTGGTYEVDAGSKLDLAQNSQIQTLNADIILSGAGSVLGSGAVLFDNTLRSIGADGELHLLNGRAFTTANSITDGGLLDLRGTTFTAPALTLTADGTLSGFGMVASTVNNAGLVEADGGVLTLQHGVANSGDMQIDAGADLVLDGAVTGSGLITFGSGAQTLSLANAALQGNNLSNVINDFGAGDKIDLTGISDATHVDFDYATNTMTVSGGAEGPITLHFDPSESFDGTVFQLSSDGGSGLYISEENNPCYCPGTLILTDRGERPVEELAIGDRVITGAGRARPIKWIGRRSYSGHHILGRKDLLPVCFKAGSLGQGLPRRDLWISPHHAMYLEDVLIEARHLVNGVSVVQAERVDEVEYFHVELDSHDVIVAEGALSESFVDDDSRMMFHNAHEYAELYPNERKSRAVYCAPRLSDGDAVETARRQIDALAGLVTPERAPTATAVRGFVDQVRPDMVSGWVSLADRPDQPVCVDVFADGRFVGTAMADRYREDLKAAGIGGGRHGFALWLPAAIDPATIKVRCSIADVTLPRSRNARASHKKERMRIAA